MDESPNQPQSGAQAHRGKPSPDAVAYAIKVLQQVEAADATLAVPCAVAIEGLNNLIPDAPRSAMEQGKARSWAWSEIKRDVGTEGWTTGESINYYGFFCHGWEARGQYEQQRLSEDAASGS